MQSRDLEGLFRSEYAGLVRLAWYLTCDRAAAEDLAAEAFVRASGSLHQVQDADSAPAYLRAIVVNLARTRWRRHAVERKHFLRSPEAAIERDTDGHIDLHSALRMLPPRKRACVVLRYFADLSEADTAGLLGISVGTVKSQTSKALAQLAVALTDVTDVGPAVSTEGRPHG